MVRDHSQITVCGYTDTLLPPHDQLLAIIPPGGLGDYILEMNARMEITPYLHTRSGYGHVRGCVSGEAGVIETRSVDLPDGETFTCQIDRFDLERDFYPYPKASSNNNMNILRLGVWEDGVVPFAMERIWFELD